MMIKIETLDEKIIEGYEITWIEANKIAHGNCAGLTYLMNVTDINSTKNTVYAWFKDDATNINYLIRI